LLGEVSSVLGADRGQLEKSNTENGQQQKMQSLTQISNIETSGKRVVLKDVGAQYSGEQRNGQSQQKALLVLSARCQQLENELALAQTKVSG
jgi:hypothetical protein